MPRRTSPSHPTRRKRVALIIETSNEYARGILHGIRAYIREHGGWDIDLDERRRGEATGWLDGWRGDGVIARIENAHVAAEVLRSKLPCVDVSAARQVPGIPWVETDDHEIAKLAFEHLRDKGLRRFAFCGDPNFNWSNWRRDHFTTLASEAGCACDVFPREDEKERGRQGDKERGGQRDKAKRRTGEKPARRHLPLSPSHSLPLSSRSRSADHEQELTSLTHWLRSLEKPTGVMACYDIRGRQVLASCKLAELAVPDDVAVIGVDNDELLCDLSDPPLTSVAPDTDSTGYLAASLLDRMMQGEKIPPTAHLVKPLGVIPRLSTDTLAVADPQMSAAVRFLRQHACEGINVADVLQQVPMSRRVFETQFKKLFGRLPHDEIVRTRLQKVKELLTHTDLPLEAIARRTGFKHVEYMSVVFKKKVGLPPSDFRSRKGR
jgi:LacI family transcriptional regulator